MKIDSITQKQLIDIKNQLNKKYDKIPLNNKKELVNCYSDIITVDNILNSYYIPPTFNEELTFFDYIITLIDKITDAEETLNNYKDFFKVLNNYYFNPGFYELYYKYQNQNYSNQDYIDMVKEFFKDKEYLNINLKTLFKSNHFTLNFFNETYDNSCGAFYYLRKYNKYLAFIPNYQSIEKGIIMAHELTHGTSLVENKDHLLSTSKTAFREFDSLFIELLACDFFKNINENEALNRKRFLHATIINSINTVYEKKNIIAELKKLNLPLYIAVQNLSSINPLYTIDYIIDVFDSSVQNDLYYSISYLYALKLYSIYQENPKEALSILKNIIHLNSTKDCLEYFKPIEKDINFDLQAYKKSLKL